MEESVLIETTIGGTRVVINSEDPETVRRCVDFTLEQMRFGQEKQAEAIGLMHELNTVLEKREKERETQK